MGFLPQVRIWGPTAFWEQHGMGTHTPSFKCTAQPAIRWKRKEAGVSPASLLHLMELAIELRRRFLQSGDQLVGGRRNGAHLPIDDFLRVGRFAIELVIGFIVGPKC